jgi:hypothetical protein
MRKMERWISEHRRDPRSSRLKRMVPTIGQFYTPLKLVDAFRGAATVSYLCLSVCVRKIRDHFACTCAYLFGFFWGGAGWHGCSMHGCA